MTNHGIVGPVEPSADMREMANHCRQMYLALVEQGFTEDEALRLLSVTLSAAFGGGAK